MAGIAEAAAIMYNTGNDINAHWSHLRSQMECIRKFTSNKRAIRICGSHE